MILILVGVLFLYLGAEGLVRGSSRIAARLGIPPLVIGLTVVAFGTSAPEMTVSVAAAVRGSGDVALGNVVGSNLFNIAVILGLTALIRPPVIHLDLIRREIPLLIVLSTIGLGIISLGEVPRWLGIVLFSGLILYTVVTVRMARAQSGDELPSADQASPQPLGGSAMLALLGLGLLVAGSHFFVTGAVALAQRFGVSEAVIGLTIVAAGTSLPELATSVVAALKRESDVAIGNIVGSNIFNLLGILGLTASISPLMQVGITWRDAWFMLGTAVLLLPFAFTRRTISRTEGGVMLAIYGIYLAMLWPR